MAVSIFTLESARKNLECNAIIDIRNVEEYSAGHIPGSQNVPVADFSRYLLKIPEVEEVYLYCGSGKRVTQLVRTLPLDVLKKISPITNSGFQDWDRDGREVDFSSERME